MSPALIKQEPLSTSALPLPNVNTLKKQVTVKLEPTLINGNNDPITPITKIVDEPTYNHNQKGYDARGANSQPPHSVKSNKDKMSSKFYLRNIDFDEETNTAKALVNSVESSVTPTRKRSKSSTQVQGEKRQKQLKKVKGMNIPLRPSTPTSKQLNSMASMSPTVMSSDYGLNSLKAKIAKPPAKFEPVKESLIDCSLEEFNELKAVFTSNFELNPQMKSKYLELSKLGSKDWISRGLQNVNRNYELIYKIIVIRVELSLKFDRIFKVINLYGEALERNDDELNDKMHRLQKLGEEIKNFIK